MAGPASRAGPFPCFKSYVRLLPAADVAGLCAGIPPVYFHQHRPLPFQLIGQEVPEHTKTVVVEVLPQLQTLSHVPQVDIFHDDDIVTVCQFPGQLVQKVLSLVGDTGVGFPDLLSFLFIIRRLRNAKTRLNKAYFL